MFALFADPTRSLPRCFSQTLSGQNAEAAEESTGASQPGAESRRQAPAPAAAGGSPLGPADQQRDGHAQRQRRLDDMLAEASRAPLPLVASNEQQDVEQQVPASLTVTVCDKPGTPMAATFTERHVAGVNQRYAGSWHGIPLLGIKAGSEAPTILLAAVPWPTCVLCPPMLCRRSAGVVALQRALRAAAAGPGGWHHCRRFLCGVRHERDGAWQEGRL